MHSVCLPVCLPWRVSIFCQLSRYILHALAYLCIIVAINFNIAMLNVRRKDRHIADVEKVA